MKRTFLQIVETITQKANEMRTNAAYGGENGDGGASRLEQDLEFFALGFKSKTGNMGILDLETKVDVPIAWQKYFFRQDPEYDEYLRLKNKFENK